MFHRKRSGESLDSQERKRYLTTITTTTQISTEIIGEEESIADLEEETNQRVLLSQIRLLQEQLSKNIGENIDESENQNILSTSLSSSTPPSGKVAEDKRPMPSVSSWSEPIPYVRPKDPLEDSTILERGHIFFFFRPRIDIQEAKGFEDVARLYLVLSKHPAPISSGAVEAMIEFQPLYRILKVGKKKLPSVQDHDRFWGIVEEVTSNLVVVQQFLDSLEYSTITQGTRLLQSCRVIGEGYYAIVHNARKDCTQLVYVLERPEEIGEPQRAFNIEKEGVLYLAVKNPEVKSTPAPSMPGLPRLGVSPIIPESPVMVQLQPDMQKSFRGRRWGPAKPVEMLNHKGLEVILIGESNDVVAEFGKIGEGIEAEEKSDIERTRNRIGVFEELHLNRSRFPVEPLMIQQWK